MATPLTFPSDLAADSNRYGNNRLCINIFKNNQSTAGEAMTTAVTTAAGNIATGDIQKMIPGATSRRTIFTEKDYTIFLPIPLALDTNYSINYSDVSVTDLGASVLGSAVGTGTNILGNLSKAKGMTGILAGAAKGVVEGLTGETSKTILKLGGIQAGLSLNPHQELLLNGVKFREFKFAYELVAKNEKDSESIKDIIKALKISMHPELAAESLLFKFPSEFELLFYTTSTTQNKYLFKTKRCILKDLQVSYGKNFVTFKDTNAPVEISISMTFQETEILDRAAIEKESGVTF